MEDRMKKLIAGVVVAGLACLMLAPQAARADVQFGLHGGVNMAKVTGADTADLTGTLKTKVGFVGGVFVAFNLGSMFTIQTEVNYTMKGVSATYTDVDVEVSEKLYSNYIEIPLLLKLKVPTPLVSPFVFVGPSVGFKLSEKVTLNGQNMPITETIFKNNDYGAIFGGGVNIGRHFFADVRYTLGLQKVLSAIDGVTPDVKNGVWSGTIGIAF
jgi:Outer membrane protein beta-barrel domain